MASLEVPQPLQIDGVLISYPFNNSDDDAAPVLSLLVNITETESTQTISLKHCCMRYYPKYDQYVKKHKNNPMHQQIVNYYDTLIESPIYFVCNLCTVFAN